MIRCKHVDVTSRNPRCCGKPAVATVQITDGHGEEGVPLCKEHSAPYSNRLAYTVKWFPVAQMKEVGDLQPGELFVWDLHPQYVHQFIADKSDDKERFVAKQIAFLCDDRWQMNTSPVEENWNPYCLVRVVHLGFTS